MTNQKLIIFFSKYFEKNKKVETIENIRSFENKYDLTISDELKCLLLDFGEVYGSAEPTSLNGKKSYIPFTINFQNEVFNFQVSVLYNNLDYIDN